MYTPVALYFYAIYLWATHQTLFGLIVRHYLFVIRITNILCDNMMYSVVFRFIISIHKIEYYGNIYVKVYKSIKGYVVGIAVTFTSLFYLTQ